MTGAGYLLFSAKGTSSLISTAPADSGYTALAYARSIVDDLHLGFSDVSGTSTTSGISWVLVLVPVQLVADFMSIPSMLLAKFVGLIFLATAGFAVLGIVKITSGTRWIAFAAVAPLLLEPRFVFASISGTEHAMFAATVAWLILFRMRKQERRTIALATVAVGFWPIGSLIFIGYAMDVVARIRWSATTAENSTTISLPQLALLRRRLIPPSAAFITIGAITFFSDNGFLPSTFSLQSHAFQWGDWSNIWKTIEHLTVYSAFDTPFFIFSLALIFVGSAAIWNRIKILSVILLPAGLVYLYLVSGWRDMSPRSFDEWSLITLIWPLVAIPLGAGMAHLLAVSFELNAGKTVAEQVGEPVARIAPSIVAVLLLLGVSSAWPSDWRMLPSEYHQGAQATHSLLIEPAQWLNENGSPDDVVIAVKAGAIRSALDQGHVYDLTGGGTQGIIGRPINSATLNEFTANWIVTWNDSAARSIAELEFAEGFSEPGGVEYPFGEIAVWKTNHNLTNVPPDEIQLAIYENLPVLGSFDIGDPQSELAANYIGDADRFVYEWESAYGVGSRLTESYSLQPEGGFDRFTLPSKPNEPALLVIRFDRTRTGKLAIKVNGVDLGIVDLLETEQVDSIATVPIPAAISDSDQFQIEVGYEVADSSQLAILHYWTFAASPQLVGRGPDVILPSESDTVVISDSFTDLNLIGSGLHFPDIARNPTSWRTDRGIWAINHGQMHELLGLPQDTRLLIEAADVREISTDVIWQNGPVGIVYGFADPANWMLYYFFPDDRGFQEVRFGVMVDGVYSRTEVWPIDNQAAGESFNLGIIINDDLSVTGLLDGVFTISTQLTKELNGAELVGLMSHGEGNAFDNFEAHSAKVP